MLSYHDQLEHYRNLPDREVLSLSCSESLTAVARQAIQAECSRRRITKRTIQRYKVETKRNPMKERNSLGSILKRLLIPAGTGKQYFGKKILSSSDRQKGIYLSTKWISFKYVPIFPLGSYRISAKQAEGDSIESYKIHSREPLCISQVLGTVSLYCIGGLLLLAIALLLT